MSKIQDELQITNHAMQRITTWHITTEPNMGKTLSVKSEKRNMELLKLRSKVKHGHNRCCRKETEKLKEL